MLPYSRYNIDPIIAIICIADIEKKYEVQFAIKRCDVDEYYRNRRISFKVSLRIVIFLCSISN